MKCKIYEMLKDKCCDPACFFINMILAETNKLAEVPFENLYYRINITSRLLRVSEVYFHRNIDKMGLIPVLSYTIQAHVIQSIDGTHRNCHQIWKQDINKHDPQLLGKVFWREKKIYSKYTTDNILFYSSIYSSSLDLISKAPSNIDILISGS